MKDVAGIVGEMALDDAYRYYAAFLRLSEPISIGVLAGVTVFVSGDLVSNVYVRPGQGSG